ncbi:MOSC domain-containing protein [Amorphus coralli]|uniref:MOSC domain-containing protein n=1 Tax=Amorphus coralli TaxID=340680 RepID=UPI00037CC147|nr:MOSC domain-containing protein [Amorphus coralli]
MTATVLAVHRSAGHTFSKPTVDAIRIVEGLGVEGDAHAGATVMHRYDRRKDPTRPNLRQVHLIQSELFDELADKGFPVGPGQMGENVTTTGVDLLTLPLGTVLRLGDEAVVELTGLRSPCKYINDLHDGLVQAVLDRDDDGNLVRKAGVMSVVLSGGTVRPGDPVQVDLPAGEHTPMPVL